MPAKKFDLIDFIIRYESGELGDLDTLKLFRYLLNTGQCWSLQGHYGRTAQALLEDGRIRKVGSTYQINRQKVLENGIH